MDVLTVNEANHYIKKLLDNDICLSNIAITGEISNYKHHYSGHRYFSLKDKQAAIRAVMFKSRAQYLKFEPADGMQVVVSGRITVFERDGQYQLYADSIVPAGVGELALAYEQLKDKLAKEGLFAAERKQALPLLPDKIGIVTSPTGAVLRDIVKVSSRRCSKVQLVLYPVQVQGSMAPDDIVKAVEYFNTDGTADVIIVGRGGGSLEDLWAFNDERVVRAVAASRLPVIAAIGHQTDFTLTDFAADVRAATPSQAAELAVPDEMALRYNITAARQRLQQCMKQQLSSKRLILEHLRSDLKQPDEMLNGRRQILDQLQQQLIASMQQHINSCRTKTCIASEKLAMLNPLAVLARGYSLIRREDGSIIADYEQTSIGEQLKVQLGHGQLFVQVLAAGEDDIYETEK